jgi:hypothetical protein
MPGIGTSVPVFAPQTIAATISAAVPQLVAGIIRATNAQTTSATNS